MTELSLNAAQEEEVSHNAASLARTFPNSVQDVLRTLETEKVHVKGTPAEKAFYRALSRISNEK